MDTTLQINPDQKMAISVRDVSLEWVTKPEEASNTGKKQHKGETQDGKTSTSEIPEQAEPFGITGLDMSISPGQLVAICGPVGSGSEYSFLVQELD
jgi:ABC-type transport system involved in cytochrome bd biosynthesis fused ATPase/permease subunit